MNLVKCENGHFYDEERYQSCPHCAAPALRNSNLTQPVQRTHENDAVTVALDQSEATGAMPSASAAPVAPVAAPAAGTASTCRPWPCAWAARRRSRRSRWRWRRR